MYPAKHVANSILSVHWDTDKRPSISPMKLQKLMYFLHGWHLAIRDGSAVNGGFDAWTYGPVNEETYHAFKAYRMRTTELTDAGETAYIVAPHVTDFYDVLNMVMDKYGQLSALRLSAMTHSTNSPWHQTRKAGGYHIDDNLIQDHFIYLAQSAAVST